MNAHSHFIAAAALALPLAAACGTGTALANDTSVIQDDPAEVKLAAKKTPFNKSVLSDGAAHSCVKVTVTNQRSSNLSVNPLYFSLTDTTNEKHESLDALGNYEDQIETTTLAPNEKVRGTVCAKGDFTPAKVAFTDELLQEIARAQVK
ncbi:DUF4352 domain-containing protein [Spirillospora sp. NPDC127200]